MTKVRPQDAVLRRADANADGVVTRAELKQFQRQLQAVLNEAKEKARVFRSIANDSTHDSQMEMLANDWETQVTTLEGVQRTLTRLVQAEGDHVYLDADFRAQLSGFTDIADRQFAINADRNRDGTLTTTEVLDEYAAKAAGRGKNEREEMSSRAMRVLEAFAQPSSPGVSLGASRTPKPDKH